MALRTYRWDDYDDDEHIEHGNFVHTVTFKDGREPEDHLAAGWQVEPQTRTLVLAQRIQLDEAHAIGINRGFADGVWESCIPEGIVFDLEAQVAAEEAARKAAGQQEAAQVLGLAPGPGMPPGGIPRPPRAVRRHPNGR
jgi:hypothetical protein